METSILFGGFWTPIVSSSTGEIPFKVEEILEDFLEDTRGWHPWSAYGLAYGHLYNGPGRWKVSWPSHGASPPVFFNPLARVRHRVDHPECRVINRNPAWLVTQGEDVLGVLEAKGNFPLDGHWSSRAVSNLFLHLMVGEELDQLMLVEKFLG